MPSWCACGCGERVAESGCFKKDHQRVGTSRDPRGLAANIKSKGKASGANAKYNATVQERARKENEERIRKMAKGEVVVSEAEAATLAHKMVKLRQCWAAGPRSPISCKLEAAHGESESEEESDVTSFYFGYTGRFLAEEYLRFLTTRGSSVSSMSTVRS